MVKRFGWVVLSLVLICGLVVYLVLSGSTGGLTDEPPAPAVGAEVIEHSRAESGRDPVQLARAPANPHTGVPLRDSGDWTGTVTGRITAIGGEPVAGAFIILYEGIDRTGEFTGPLERTLSGPSGEYSMTPATDARSCLVVRAEGYVQTVQWIEAPGGVTLVRDFVLNPASARLSGTVRDEAGHPIAGAWVTSAFAEPDLGDRPLMIPPRTQTDSAGVYELDGLPARSVTLLVTARGFQFRNQGLELAAGDSATVDFVLQKNRTIRVAVKSRSGEPISGAVASCDAPQLFPAIADEGGVVEISFSERHSGRLTCSFSANGFLSTRVELDPENPPRHVFLDPATSFGGLVVSDRGEGIQRARVLIQCGDHRRAQTASSETDESVRFELHPPCAEVWEISIRARGYRTFRYRSATPIPAGRTFTLSRSESSLQGRVIWSDGSPVANFVVVA
ncbi:MAG: carboxypeptidase-like regulatory domain-containing protein, partial [Acidobacteriota bacterium]